MTIENLSDLVIVTPASRLGGGTTVYLNGELIEHITSLQITIAHHELVKVSIVQHIPDAEGKLKLVSESGSRRVSEHQRHFTGQLSVWLGRALELLHPDV